MDNAEKLWLPKPQQRSIFFNLLKDSNKSFTTCLMNQKRSAPELVEILNQYLYRNKISSTVDASKLMNIMKQGRQLHSIFINVDGKEEFTGYYEEVDGFQEKSFHNKAEVLVMKNLLAYLVENRLIKNDIGKIVSKDDFLILSGYNGQVRLLKEELNKNCIENYDIRSIDSSQGSEKQIVILSMVRTKSVGFLKSIQRLVVALSRPKSIMIIVGCAKLLEHQHDSDLLRLVVAHHKNNSNYYDSLLKFMSLS